MIEETWAFHVGVASAAQSVAKRPCLSRQPVRRTNFPLMTCDLIVFGGVKSSPKGCGVSTNECIWRTEIAQPSWASASKMCTTCCVRRSSQLKDQRFGLQCPVSDGEFPCCARRSVVLGSVSALAVIRWHTTGGHKVQLQQFRSMQGIVGRPAALLTRKTLGPHAWWNIYGACTPELQQMAIQVLSQVPSPLQLHVP